MVEYLQFWGKAQPSELDNEPDYHPLAFHSLDVAAVGESLLRSDAFLLTRFNSLLGMESTLTVPLLCFLLAMHDIGKFAKRFQAKIPSHFPDCFVGEELSTVPTDYDHGNGGLLLFDADASIFQLPKDTDWRPMIAAVTGHHGSPPKGQRGIGVRSLRSRFGIKGINAAAEFARHTINLFEVPHSFPQIPDSCIRRASFPLAGLAVLTDWIGSNRSWFPYQECNFDLASYWRDTRQRAQTAILEAGVLPSKISTKLTYDDLVGECNVHPSPMQQWVQSVELPQGPTLFILEDETGSGKTESALMLAHRMMVDGHADGLYIALPTLATANAMFDRLAHSYRRLFAYDALPSIVLAHGARFMHEGFKECVLPAGRMEPNYSSNHDENACETTASAACAAWVASDNRRGFLADIGAGTIDQAIMSVLPTRHQSLRLLGIMRHVLIIDEVHAYDSYLQGEIEKLIEFQAGLGGSVILLSASLPEVMRQKLSTHFIKGIGKGITHGKVPSNYPLATMCSVHGNEYTSLAGRAERARRIPVKFLRSVEDALIRIVKAAENGQAVLYLRNTVEDVLDTHRELSSSGLNVHVFHARFALIDRLNIERMILDMFGKSSTPKERMGQVLIATQVVEQSLDLDFDLIITDLAPIDLIIQRAGRLWRHHRPNRVGEPILYVVGPKPVTHASESWFKDFFPRASFVYENHALLWVTSKILEEQGAIESPTGVRSLIESVYGENALSNIPPELEKNRLTAEGNIKAYHSLAGLNTLDFSRGFLNDYDVWNVDNKTPTRVQDEEHVTLRLARASEGEIEPYSLPNTTEESWKAWRLSEVNVARRRVPLEFIPEELRSAARKAKSNKENWTRYDLEKILVVLRKDKSADGQRQWTGCAIYDNKKMIYLRYTQQRGLEFIKNNSSNL